MQFTCISFQSWQPFNIPLIEHAYQIFYLPLLWFVIPDEMSSNSSSFIRIPIWKRGWRKKSIVLLLDPWFRHCSNSSLQQQLIVPYAICVFGYVHCFLLSAIFLA